MKVGQLELHSLPMRSDALYATSGGNPPAARKYAGCGSLPVSPRPGTKCTERQTSQKVHRSDCGYVIDAVTLEQARATAARGFSGQVSPQGWIDID